MNEKILASEELMSLAENEGYYLIKKREGKLFYLTLWDLIHKHELSAGDVLDLDDKSDTMIVITNVFGFDKLLKIIKYYYGLKG